MTGVLPTTWIVLVHLTMSKIPGAARGTSPLHECLIGSKAGAGMGGRLLCLSIPRKPKVRHTLMDGPKEPRLEKSWQRKVRSWDRMGRQHRGGVLIIKSVAQRSDVTWKLLDASGPGRAAYQETGPQRHNSSCSWMK